MTEFLRTQATNPVTANADAAPIAVPSGQRVSLLEVIHDAQGPAGLALRFRFLAPEIGRGGGGVDFVAASADMLHLCQNYALARLAEFGPQPSQIIISLSDMPVTFGQAAPEATQFFEAFALQDGACIWEVF